MKKFYVLLIFLLSFNIYVYAPILPTPSIWIKYSENLFRGYGLANPNIHSYWVGDTSVLDIDLINGYPSIYIGDNDNYGYFSFDTDVFDNKPSALLLIAYQPFIRFGNGVLEYGVWTLQKEDTITLTSIRYSQNRHYNFRYQHENYPGAIITSNMVMLNKKGITDSSVPVSMSKLLLGYADKLKFKGKIAEFIVINNFIDNPMRQVWQSYLALKYGSTLYHGNYVNSSGDTLWYYKENEEFSNGVGGIGRDDLLGLNQNLSTISGDILTISYNNHNNIFQSSQKKFNNGEYVFWGYNYSEASLGTTIFPIGDSTYYLLDRVWKLRSYTDSGHSLDFQINIPAYSDIKMFISRNRDFCDWETHIILSSDFTDHQAKFSGLNFSDSVTYFTFGYSQKYIDSVASNYSWDNSDNNLQNPALQVFAEASYMPNPVKDNLYIDYKLTRRASLRFLLCNSYGSIVYCSSTLNKSQGRNQTIISMGHLPMGAYTLYVHVDDMVLSQVIIKQ